MQRRAGLIIVVFATCLIAPLLLASHQTGPADALQSGTVWTGQAAGDPRKPKQDRERGAEMRVTSRDGEKFEADLVVRGGRAIFALQLEGRLRKGQVAAKVTRIVRGTWPDGMADDLWTGTLSGEQLVLKHTGKQNLVTTITLKLDPEAAERAKQRGRGRKDD